MSEQPIPLPRGEVIDHYFMEHRAKLIDVAAYLDRVDRARGTDETPDFRDLAFRQALTILTDGKPQRARRVLELFSDPTAELPQSAQGVQGATGAYRLGGNEESK